MVQQYNHVNNLKLACTHAAKQLAVFHSIYYAQYSCSLLLACSGKLSSGINEVNKLPMFACACVRASREISTTWNNVQHPEISARQKKKMVNCPCKKHRMNKEKMVYIVSHVFQRSFLPYMLFGIDALLVVEVMDGTETKRPTVHVFGVMGHIPIRKGWASLGLFM